MSAYQYRFIPGAHILHLIQEQVGSGENYLEEQHLALRESRKKGLFHQKQMTLELDDARMLGYSMLLSAPNAVTSLGTYSYQAPRSDAERERVLLQQELGTEQINPTVASDLLTKPAIQEDVAEGKKLEEEDVQTNRK